MDFSKLGSISFRQELPKDPIKIFEALPSLDGTPNDLWRGQAEALKSWYCSNDKNDVLVSLNTGAGKTIVGLLIAQSLINQGYENVLYVCSTINLVEQTEQEAIKIGIQCTTRMRGVYSNNLFESCKAFCITTYHALFNGHSTIVNNYFPQAIIFDDAHVAESMLRDAYTMTIKSSENIELFDAITNLFESDFRELGIKERFKDSISKGYDSSVLVPPRILQKNKEQLLQLFDQYNISGDNDLSYAFQNLKDNIDLCAGIFNKGVFEISPPFLPSLAIDVFERNLKRVYLSATLQSTVEFIRAFGRKPDTVISPSNDAGNGERLIIPQDDIENGFSLNFAEHIAKSMKIVIAVPNYSLASAWEDLAKPPQPNEFSNELEEFKNSETGAFVLVSRVDGIDLPHSTCRVMLIDGLPSGKSLLEKYQFEILNMQNMYASKIATRLAQLFGRINRGRKDYGIFLLKGTDLNTWLSKDKHIALLPELLQQQIMLGNAVKKGFEINNANIVIKTMKTILYRDQGWLDYYNSNVNLGKLDEDKIDKINKDKSVLEAAAIAEAKYMAYMWCREYADARIVIEESSNKISSADNILSGWHSVWLGATYDLEQDLESAENAYHKAMDRIGRSTITLPKRKYRYENNNESPKNNFYQSLHNYLGFATTDKCQKEIKKAKGQLNWLNENSTNKNEEAVRLLGEILGFESSRPDNDLDTGPDVLWIDKESSQCLAFELKTDKESPVNYVKKDISQGHDHIQWCHNNAENLELLGLTYIAHEKGEVDRQANLDNKMCFTTTNQIIQIMDRVLALFDDLIGLTPLQRNTEMIAKSKEAKWKIESIFDELKNN